MIRYIFSLLIGCCIFSKPVIAAETIVFGVVPQQSAKKLAQTWTPFLNELSKASGLNIAFATAKDIPTFEQRLSNGTYDIAYMNPYHYVVYNKLVGYQALAKQRNKRIQGIIVVRKDSSIQSLEELNGQVVAFPAPAAFAATIIPQAKFAELGIKVTPRYVSSHDSVYLNIARSFVPAGGGVLRTLNATNQEVYQELRVLWRSNEYTSHAIATSAGVSLDTRAKLLNGLLAFNNNEKYKTLLDDINFKGFEAASNTDWDDIRALEIALLSDATP